MNIKNLYSLFEQAYLNVPEIKSFYFIESFDKNDAGDPEEYPKLILRKPVNASYKNQSTSYNVVVELVNSWDANTTDSIKTKASIEVDVIDQCEALLILFLDELQKLVPSIKVNAGEYTTIHEDGVDQYSGVELSFTVTLGNVLCNRLILTQ